MLWILDASINISMEPFRAFVGDKLTSAQRTTGFATQTFFIGLGAVIASLLPYIFTNVFHISNTAPAGQIGDSVKYSFYIGAVVFFVAVLWTVLTSDEAPPENMDEWKKEKMESKGIGNAISEITKGIFSMPKTMAQLAVVQFFTWVGFYCMWLYTTASVAQNAYGTIDTTSKAFQDAGDWVGVMFMVYSAVSAITAFLLPMLANRIGQKIYPYALPDHWRFWIDINHLYKITHDAFGAHDCCRTRMGVYLNDAVFNSCRRFTTRKNGILYGRI